ncbi:MAG: 30S ribosomal protein S6 [Filimonas sp.]|nr:30S ribosomal protein S6 [Filimonas sp.]
MSRYETVFVLAPHLSEEYVKIKVAKFRKVLTDRGAKIIFEENWDRRGSGVQLLTEERWASLEKKDAGYYQLFEFTTDTSFVITELEIAFKRDEWVLRFMTVKLDRH